MAEKGFVTTERSELSDMFDWQNSSILIISTRCEFSYAFRVIDVCRKYLRILIFQSFDYITHRQCFHRISSETLSSHTIASLKLAENLFACSQNSQFRFGIILGFAGNRSLTDNNICLAEEREEFPCVHTQISKLICEIALCVFTHK